MLSSYFSGELNIEVFSLYLSDPFGIFWFKANCFSQTRTAVEPSTKIIAVELNGIEDSSLSDEEYLLQKRGYDSSSAYGVREYAEGDNVKSIHRKLSEKLDRTMVRESALPFTEKVLLLFQNESSDPWTISTAVETLWAITLSLIEKEVPITFAFCPQKHQLTTFSIATIEEAKIGLGELLRGVSGDDVISAYLLNSERVAYSHTVVVSDGAVVKPSRLLSNNRVTVISPKKLDEGESSLGVYSVVYSGERIESDLAEVLI